MCECGQGYVAEGLEHEPLTQTPAEQGEGAPPAGIDAQLPPHPVAASGLPQLSARPTTWPLGLCLQGVGMQGGYSLKLSHTTPGAKQKSQGGAGGSPVVAAMLELMEKLQAGVPAASEQLLSSCRYPRASENSLWQEGLAVRTGGRGPGRVLALPASLPLHQSMA